MSIIEDIKESVYWQTVDYEKVKKYNPQLNHPSVKKPSVPEIKNKYSLRGYDALTDYYKKTTSIKRYKQRIVSIIPYRMLVVIKKMIK